MGENDVSGRVRPRGCCQLGEQGEIIRRFVQTTLCFCECSAKLASSDSEILESDRSVTQIYASNADEWRDIASQSFVPLSFQRAATQFTATMDQRQLAPDVSLAKIETQPLIIDRTQRLVAQAESDDIHISLQVNACGSISQHGNVVSVGPGVITLCETHKPFTLNYVEPNQRHIVLQTSRSALGVDKATIDSLAGRQVTRANPARDAFASFVSSLMTNRQPFSETTHQEFSRVVTSLAAAMLETEADFSRSFPVDDGAMLATILDFIRSNLTSPMLSPKLVAQAHFVSRRKLYDLFDALDQTPAEFIRSERLSRAAGMLSGNHSQQMKVSDIAFSVGFSDITTFTRAFRRQYGAVPRDFRAMHVSVES